MRLIYRASANTYGLLGREHTGKILTIRAAVRRCTGHCARPGPQGRQQVLGTMFNNKLARLLYILIPPRDFFMLQTRARTVWRGKYAEEVV